MIGYKTKLALLSGESSDRSVNPGHAYQTDYVSDQGSKRQGRKGGGAHATLTMREKGEDRDVSSHESDKPGTHYPERGAIL